MTRRQRPYIRLRAPVERADDRVRFRLSTTAQGALALDDPALVREAYPSLTLIRWNRLWAEYEAARRDLPMLTDDLFERADPAPEGFGEPANVRAACRRDGHRLYDAWA